MLYLYSKELNSRLLYIFDFIFGDILHVPLSYSTDPEDFKNHIGPKINYSTDFVESSLNLAPHPLLLQQGIKYQNMETFAFEGDRYFFKSSKDSFLPFDPFAASFFLITRYEEYLETDFGKHRRYPSKHSILHKMKQLQIPVVNKWGYLIAEKIKSKYPEFEYREPTFDYLTTIDIDNAWAYKNKSLLRTYGACLKAISIGDIGQINERLSVLRGKKSDPYDTYDFIADSFKEKPDKLRFFILAGKPGKYDRNVSPENKSFQNLIKRLAADFSLGIHPSYGSVRNKKRLKKEIAILEEIIQQHVHTSRQHFLKLEFPKTYRRLIKARIRHDYTLGYADQIGFRAGTASPFYFYDLVREKKTTLMIHPFQLMDVTMNDYLKLNPNEAIEKIKELMTEIKRFGGTFISIFHNESLNDKGKWNGWKTVFEEMNQLAEEFSNEK